MRNFIRFFVSLLLIFFVSGQVIPARYQTHYPRELGPEFTPQIRQDWKEKLEIQKSDVIFMGDSVLFEGINPIQFEEISGIKPLFVAIPGSSSALWYAIIKNNIILADASPKYLFIFFRDTMLTTPDFRVTGKYFTMLDEFASPNDTLIVQKAYVNSMNRCEQLLERYFPLYGNRIDLRNSIDYRMKYTSPFRLLACGEECVDQSISDAFSKDKMIPAIQERLVTESEDYLYDGKNLDFNRQFNFSFLPEIISLLNQRQIQPVFVQVKTLKYETSHPSAAIMRYFNALETFASDHNIPYLTYLSDDRINKEYFVDEIHLTDEGQTFFTSLFSNDIKSLLNRTPLK